MAETIHVPLFECLDSLGVLRLKLMVFAHLSENRQVILFK
jgi:hypothetical protein